MYVQNNRCHQATAHLQLNILLRTTHLSLKVFSWALILDYFSKIFREYSSSEKTISSLNGDIYIYIYIYLA